MADMTAKIKQALTQLDPVQDGHWTSDGAPRMDVVEKLVGTKGITRSDVNKAGPTFTRDHPHLESPVSEQEPEAEAPQVAGPEQDVAPASEPQTDAGEPSEPMDELEVALAKAKKELAEAEEAKHAAQKRAAEAQRKVDEVIEARERDRPVHENIKGIQAYIARQQEIRQARAARAQQLQQAGLDAKTLAQLTGPAKIDQAMARKTGYGQERPTRQVNPPKQGE